MFSISHKKSYGSFVNEEAKKKNASAILKHSYFISHFIFDHWFLLVEYLRGF
jgi:hypothetical protein